MPYNGLSSIISKAKFKKPAWLGAFQARWRETIESRVRVSNSKEILKLIEVNLGSNKELRLANVKRLNPQIMRLDDR